MVLKIIAVFICLTSIFACKPPAKDCAECEAEQSYSGRNLYMNQCISCHGENGQLGNSGAKDLSISKLSPEEIREILSEGKGAMPPALELMEDPKHMDSVIQFVQTLKNK